MKKRKKEIKVPSGLKIKNTQKHTNKCNEWWGASKLHKEGISSYSLAMLLFVSEQSGTYVD